MSNTYSNSKMVITSDQSIFLSLKYKFQSANIRHVILIKVYLKGIDWWPRQILSNLVNTTRYMFLGFGKVACHSYLIAQQWESRIKKLRRDNKVCIKYMYTNMNWTVKKNEIYKFISKRRIISLRHSHILRRIWLNFMAHCLVFIRRFFQFSHLFFGFQLSRPELH
jgi:hypothetical protein